VAALLAPAGSTPLAALPAVALDLETTGLDPRTDRIVQVAAIAMLGPKILEAPRLERLVDPGVPIPPGATAIHGLGERELAGAPRFAGLATALVELLQGRVVVGHRVAFDLAVLRHEAARVGIPWYEPPMLDVAQLFASLQPAHDLTLEAVAAALGVTIQRRHTASGDALAAAQIFSRLLARLRDLDVRTLAEAQSFAARRSNLAQDEMEAAWQARPRQASPARASEPAARVDSYIFERSVADVMNAPPVAVDPDLPLAEAARRMTAQRIGALLVAAPDGRPAGIVTERDLLRASGEAGLDLAATPVSRAMSRPVECIDAHEPLYRALGRMDRRGFRHLCVLDEAGRAIGMLSQRDLLAHRARATLALDDDIRTAADATALAAAYGRLPRVARGLAGEGVRGLEVARVVSAELRAVTARAAEIATLRLSAEGRPPPAPWCLLVLGSAGRSESLLGADQDNALVHAGGVDDDPWFAGLGALLAQLLDEAGVAKCQGGVMAASAGWRGTLAEWRRRIDGWVRAARPQDLLNVDIFFDLILALMARSVTEVAPTLGPLGGLRLREGRVDLKRQGLLPLVGLARTLALRIGSAERSTPARLHAAAAAGRLAEKDATMLVALHGKLLDLVLRQQLLDMEAGLRPSGRVAMGALGWRGARALARDLRSLAQIVDALPGLVAA
jgi:DNA polymerase-3 subunit epsilon/CBS domain-containing protein